MSNAVDMVDVTHGSLGNVRRLKIKKAGYTTGSAGIQWSKADWENNPTATVRIDQSPGTYPNSGNTKDIEAYASNIPEAIQWASAREKLGLHSTFYVSAANLMKCEQAVQAAELEGWVFYWLADWNLSRAQAIAELGGRIVAIQYASPTSNPETFIPGTRITLSEANVDLSVTVPWWHRPETPKRHFPPHRKPHKPAKPHPKVIAGTGGGGLTTGLIALVTHVFHVHLTPTEGGAIATAVAALAAYYFPSVNARP